MIDKHRKEEIGMNTETKFKVGQTVWDVVYGKGVVEGLGVFGDTPLSVGFFDDEGKLCFTKDYTLDGKPHRLVNRTLYFSEPKIIAETEPPFEPKLKKGDEVLVTYLDKSFITQVQKETEDSIVYTEEGHFWRKIPEVKFYKLPEVQLITFD